MPPTDFRSLPNGAIVIHGGMHKTGSSTIQNTLAAHRGLLAAAGWLYPQAGLVMQDATGHRHRTLMAELRKPKGDPAWALLRDELQHWPGRVLISHENFFSPQISPHDIKAQLPGRDVYLLAYLRHPVDYIESCYREWVRRWKYAKSIRNFYEARRDYLDIQSGCDAWANAFGAAHQLLRPYDRDHLAGGSVLSDFLSTLGLDGVVPLPAHPSNESLNTSQTLVYLLANQLRASPGCRDSLAAVFGPSGAAPASQPATDLAVAVARLQADSSLPARLLQQRLGGTAPASRVMDDKLVQQIEKDHVGDFRGVLAAHRAAPGALARSAFASLPCDPAFADHAVRAIIEDMLN